MENINLPETIANLTFSAQATVDEMIEFNRTFSEKMTIDQMEAPKNPQESTGTFKLQYEPCTCWCCSFSDEDDESLEN